MSNSFNLKTGHKQCLSTQKIQSLKILEMDILELRSFLEKCFLENPLIELDANEGFDGEIFLNDKERKWAEETGIDLFQTIGSRGVFESRKDDIFAVQNRNNNSLEEFLIEGIDGLNLTDEEKKVALFVIKDLDSYGFIGDNENVIAESSGAELSVVENTITKLQLLEPKGICARSLRECLCLQLEGDSPIVALAREIVDCQFDNFLAMRPRKISHEMAVPHHKIEAACSLLRGLNPRPANFFGTGASISYVVPDVLVERSEKQWVVRLNEHAYPRVSVACSYDSAEFECSIDAEDYLRTMRKEARRLKEWLDQRRKTLLDVVSAIVILQDQFFLMGCNNLHPLRQVDIANRLGIHESTVSRSIRGKYLSCDWGVFPLHSFFSVKVRTADGNMTASAKKAMALIRDMIDSENMQHPISDQGLSNSLAELGLHISRRTVAKYRDEMAIPRSSVRKQLN